jgi:hypothetical protein
MSAFLLHARVMWNHYFFGTNVSSQTFTSRQTPSDSCVYVSNCLFKFITSTSNGGALSCTTVAILLVESTSFFSCNISSDRGGAIYFSSGAGQCVLREVCGYDCGSTYKYSYNQFAYVEVVNSVMGINHINYSTITRCVNENSGNTLSLKRGIICCPSVNISLNKGSTRLIECMPSSDSNSVTCSFSYSTVVDNNSTRFTCFILWSYTGFEFKSCNIFRNTQKDLSSEGTFFTLGNVTIKDSCILGNNANYIFHQRYSSNTFTISNCTVDRTTNNGCLTIQSTATKSFILTLNHMSTHNCHAEYSMNGMRASLIQSSKQLFSILLEHINALSLKFLFH